MQEGETVLRKKRHLQHCLGMGNVSTSSSTSDDDCVSQALEALPVPQHAEPSVYSALVQCLWESGLPAAQGHALWLFTSGCRQGMVPPVMQQSSEEDRTLEVTCT